jgi:hypothetical protein
VAFVGDSLIGLTFGSLGIGAQVTFVANLVTKRGVGSLAPTGVERPRS